MRPSTIFLYGLAITLLAFLSRDFKSLLILSVINGSIGLYLGLRRGLKFFILLFFIGLIGVLINALLFANYGEPIIIFDGIILREMFINSFILVTLRLFSILGVALIFTSLVNTRDFIKSLEAELYLPKDIAFATSIGIRMLNILTRDSEEIRHIRVMRGKSKYPITPSAFLSYLRPLLSLSVERAKWIGIAAEMRGFERRKRSVRRGKFSRSDLLIVILLIFECVMIIVFSINIM